MPPLVYSLQTLHSGLRMPPLSWHSSLGEDLLIASGALKAPAFKTSLLPASRLTSWLGNVYALQHYRRQREGYMSDGSTFADWLPSTAPNFLWS